MKHSRILGILSMWALAFLYLALAVWLYWTLYPYQTVKYLNDPFPVVPKEIKQGEQFTYNIHYCKYTDDAPVRIEKTFIDGIEFVAAKQVPLIGTKGCGEIDIPVLIPDTLPAGTYRLRVQVFYKVNPIREIEKVTETEEFKVIAK